jgi:putative ABC transport system permease protein
VSVENITVVDSENKSVGPTTGAPTIATDWYVTDRSPVKLTSGHAPRGAERGTPRRGHRRQEARRHR